MAVAITAFNLQTSNAAATLDTGNVTVTTSATNLLICFVMLRSRTASPSAVAYNKGASGQTLTLVTSDVPNGGGNTKLWVYAKLGTTAATSKPITVDIDATTEVAVSGVYCTGVDSGSLGASLLATIAAKGNSTAPSTGAMASASGNATVDVAVADNANPAISNPATGTQTTIGIGNQANEASASGYTLSGGSGNTHTWALSGAGPYQWLDIGLEIKAVGAASRATKSSHRAFLGERKRMNLE